MSPNRRLWVVSVVVGAGLGAFSMLADGIIGGRLIGILGNIASPWGLAGYFVGEVNLLWTAIALVAGPVMGWSGAAITSKPDRPPALAVAAPSAMLVAEAIFLAIDRRVWHYDLRAETYRLIDL